MTSRYSSGAALLLVAALHSSVSGGSLRKVWELDLTAEIKGPHANAGFQPGILAIRFSPDGKRIAIATNPYRRGRSGGVSKVIAIVVESPKRDVQSFEIEDIASDSPNVSVGPPAISWSPSGYFILAGLSLIRLKDGAVCEIPNSMGHGFVGPDRIIAGVLLGIEGGRAKSRMELFDTECKSMAIWQPPYQEWTIRDVLPEQGVVSLTGGKRTRGFEADPGAQLAVVDVVSWKVIRSWLAAETGGDSRFADHGRVLCAGDNGVDLYHESKTPPRCMDVDTGEKIAEARGIIGGSPMVAAEHASRVVASDQRSTWNFLFSEYDTALTRRVVWDVRKNVEVASWKPATQTYDLLGPKPARDPFMFAISPDGEYIAEGGNGALRLYKIEP